MPWILGGAGALVLVIVVVVTLVLALNGPRSRKPSLADKSADELIAALSTLSGLPEGSVVKAVIAPNWGSSLRRAPYSGSTFDPAGCVPPFSPEEIYEEAFLLVSVRQGGKSLADAVLIKGTRLIDFEKLRDWTKGCSAFTEIESNGRREQNQLRPVSLPDSKADRGGAFSISGEHDGGTFVFGEARGLTTAVRSDLPDAAGQVFVALVGKLDAL